MFRKHWGQYQIGNKWSLGVIQEFYTRWFVSTAKVGVEASKINKEMAFLCDFYVISNNENQNPNMIKRFD